MVGGEVTGWCFGNLIINLLAPNSLRSLCLWSAVSIQWGPDFCKTTQGYVSDCIFTP